MTTEPEETTTTTTEAPTITKNPQLAQKLFAEYKAKTAQLDAAKKSIEALSAERGKLAESIATEAGVTSFKHDGIEYSVGRVGKSKTYTVKRRSQADCVEFS